MSFQDYLPICPLDLSLSLDLLLFHIYFKFSSFCLCRSSLRFLSPCSLSASKNLSLPISRRSPHIICWGWQAPVLSSLSSLGGSQSRKALGSLWSSCKQTELLWWEERFGIPVCLLGPRQRAHSWVWLEQTQGSDGLVSVLGFPSYVIMRESHHRAKLHHGKRGWWMVTVSSS